MLCFDKFTCEHNNKKQNFSFLVMGVYLKQKPSIIVCKVFRPDPKGYYGS